MKAKVFGVYDEALSTAEVAERRVAIDRRCRDMRLPSPSFEQPNFLSATVLACESPVRAWLVGSLGDLHAPPESAPGFSDEEWREGWMEYLAEESLTWLSIDTPAGVATENLSRVSVVRSYRRAWKMLMRLLAKTRAERSKNERASANPLYTAGRPPYGYRAHKGTLVLDSPEVLQKVQKVYELVRQKVPIKTIADMMEAGEASSPEWERRWWDPVKIRRLLDHARLYCLGEYERNGQVTKAPELAFLPKDWHTTTPYRRHHPPLEKTEAVPVLAEPDRVPSRPRSGKLRASSPPSN